MSKRTASSNLDQDNWNQEEPPEEMGTFQRASPCALKDRAIKKAKRRAGTEEGVKVSVFQNFTAFATGNSESSVPTFSFLSENSEKPKLTNPNPFPSFSFSSVNSQSKQNLVAPSLPSKTSTGNEGNISFSFTGSSNPVENKLKKPQSPPNDKNSTSDSGTFGKLEDKPSLSSSFNLNPVKGFDSTEKSPGGSSLFKFGFNSKDDSTKPVAETSFQFGGNSKESKTVKASDIGTDKQTFQFGLNSNNSNKINSLQPSSSSQEALKSPKVNGTRNSSDSTPSKNSVFLANLKALNIGVVNWVKQHVDKNHYINLSPIFDDYKKHFEEIKTKFDVSNEKKCADSNLEESKLSKPSPLVNESQTSTKAESLTKTSSSSIIPDITIGSSNAKSSSKSEPFIFGGSSISTNGKTNKTSEDKTFSFGITKSSDSSNNQTNSQKSESKDSVPKSSAPTFSFGLADKTNPPFAFGSNDNKPFSFGSSDNSSKASGFSFGVTKDTKSTGFSFDSNSNKTPGFTFKTDSPNFKASSTNDADKKDAGAGEEESDEVPKVEVAQVKEDDAIYEKKVKLFYKKEDQYVDRGVGNLFLKPAEGKIQLIIRAFTNLGNILLNIVLNDSIPTQRVGKNHVLIVCVPNPPIDPKSTGPVSMLIKVKTEEDADELLKKIDENKK